MQDPGEGAGLAEVTARVEQDRVADLTVEQAGGVTWGDSDAVAEQAQSGKHLGGGLGG